MLEHRHHLEKRDHFSLHFQGYSHVIYVTPLCLTGKPRLSFSFLLLLPVFQSTQLQPPNHVTESWSKDRPMGGKSVLIPFMKKGSVTHFLFVQHTGKQMQSSAVKRHHGKEWTFWIPWTLWMFSNFYFCTDYSFVRIVYLTSIKVCMIRFSK